jgi:PleD family two-component response regulator
MDGHAAGEIAERFGITIEAIRARNSQQEFGFTASMGVASLTPVDRNFESALSRADTALYVAKGADRNCVKVA